ncbi:hypothetical protein [Aestuariimicrobium ganziense]|uniref:hypothetical protein n=1 Tax=Aestuariimicrobium ganziense TaxID=2773677 RepID=UPI0038B2E2CE
MPILVFALTAAGRFAHAERDAVERWSGDEIPAPHRWPRATVWPAWPSGCAASVGDCWSTHPRAVRPSCRQTSDHAHLDRRRLGAAR